MKRLSLVLFWILPMLGAMDPRESRHLLARTQFGITGKQINMFNHMNRAEAVEWVLSNVKKESTVEPLAWMLEESLLPEIPYAQMTEQQREEFLTLRRNQILELKAWWAYEMVETPSEFTEIMTLFWHNHFTSELQKVKVAHLMYRQDILLRKNAFGNFRDLLHEVAKDPAMIIYLDNNTNVKDHPNENFARELMELFTLGEGNYSESDVKESARAFTGWNVRRDTGRFIFDRGQHDFNEKTFLGQTGDFFGEDILDIILEQNRTAEFITEKLWQVFINANPDPGEVTKISSHFRSSGYEIKQLMSELLNSDYFWAEVDRGSLVKSPAELIVGTIRSFRLPITDVRYYSGIARATAFLGQNLFDPPNVKGWESGIDWITTSTLLDRRETLKTILRINENGSSLQFLFPRFEEQFLINWLLAIDPAGSIDDGSLAQMVSSIVLDPAYQVK